MRHAHRSRPKATSLFKMLAIASVLATTCVTASAEAPATTTPSVIIHDTDDLNVAVAEALASRSEGANHRVLLIFDIDNTLLTMPQFLGSDQWFNYHAGQITAGKDPDFAAFSDLIAVQTTLFSLGSMHPTQSDVGSLIEKANNAGIDIYLLSARGPELYSVTKRELGRNSIAFQAPVACSFVICSLGGSYGDSEIRHAIMAAGGTAQTPSYREIVMRDGVMMVAGQDKGTMLRVLLAALLPKTYDQIIFVDDTQKNIDAVAAAQVSMPISLYHYTRIQTTPARNDLDTSERQWKALRRTICISLTTSICNRGH